MTEPVYDFPEADDPVVKPLARELLDCLVMEADKLPEPPKRACLRPGTNITVLLSTMEDECCEGLAWVRFSQMYPSSTTFPVQDTQPPKGDMPAWAWAIELEMGIARCAPAPDANTLTDCDDWTNLSESLMDDAAAMRRAMCCFIRGDRARRGKVLPGVYAPLPVDGACVGGTWPLLVQGPTTCDCPDDVS